MIGDLNLCLPGTAAVKLPALLQKQRPGGAVDCAVYASPSKEAAVGCVYNRFQIIYFSNIALHNLNVISHFLHLEYLNFKLPGDIY